MEKEIGADFISRFAVNLAMQFGASCEVAVHRFKGEALVITQIENGHVTGRRIGDDSTNEFLEEFSEKDFMRNPVYRLKTAAGRDLISSTTYFEEDGQVAGFVCVNYDVTDILKAYHDVPLLRQGMDLGDVNHVLEQHLQAAEQMIGKSAGEMTREEKYRAVEYLENQHVFLISKSGNRVCEFLNITKYCLYSFLKEIRGADQEDAPMNKQGNHSEEVS